MTARYILYMLQKVFYGPPQEKFNDVPDADRIEKICIFTFVGAILLVGIYPAILTDVIKMGIAPIMTMFGM